VYQALVPKLWSHCRVPAETIYEPAYLKKIEQLFKIPASSIHAKNVEGCPHCQRKALPELNGSRGRIVVAEMIEPTPKMLLLFRDSKNLELKEHVRSLRTAGFDEPDTTGKSALEVAMYHVARGVIDPKEVELKFGSFDQYEQEIAEQKRAA
jgi:general secretion pathway protein E